MPYCEYCGKRMSDGARFCSKCGAEARPDTIETTEPRTGTLTMTAAPATQPPTTQAQSPQPDQQRATPLAGHAIAAPAGTYATQPVPARRSRIPIAIAAVLVLLVTAGLVGGMATGWYGLAGGDASQGTNGATVHSPFGQFGDADIRKQIGIDFSASPDSNLVQGLLADKSEEDIAAIMRLCDETQEPGGKYLSLRRLCDAAFSEDSPLGGTPYSRIPIVNTAWIIREHLFNGMDVTIDNIEVNRSASSDMADRNVTLSIRNEWFPNWERYLRKLLSGEFGGPDDSQASRWTQILEDEAANLKQSYQDGSISLGDATVRYRTFLREAVDQCAEQIASGVDDDVIDALREFQKLPDTKTCRDIMLNLGVERFKCQVNDDDDNRELCENKLQTFAACLADDAIAYMCETQRSPSSTRKVTYRYVYDAVDQKWTLPDADNSQARQELYRILGSQDATKARLTGGII